MTKTLQMLSWTRPLEPREPAIGFASRLASLHRRGLGEFVRDLGLPPRDLDLGTDDAIRALSQLGGCSHSRLCHYSPKRLVDRNFQVGRNVIERSSVARTMFRFCPLCVREDLDTFDGPEASRPWLRFEWQIKHFRSCQKHSIVLVDAQPVRHQFEPYDVNATLAPLLSHLGDIAAPLDKYDGSEYQNWLIRRFDGTSGAETWLDRTPLAAAIAFCEALGVSALHPPKVRVSEFRLSDWARVADEGYRIASAGEDDIRSLLDRLAQAQSNTRGYWGLRDTYGYVYQLLEKHITDSDFEQPLALFREHAVNNLPLEPGTDILGMPLTERRVHTIRSVAIESGVHSRSIRKLFIRNGLTESRDSGGAADHRVLVDADQMAETVEALKTSITTPQAIARTGMPRRHFFTAVQLHLIPTITNTNSVADAKHKFSPSGVDAFMEKLFADAVSIPKPTEPFVDLTEARRRATCSMEDLLTWVFDGTVKSKRRIAGRGDYGALLVDANEVVALTRTEAPLENYRRRDVCNVIAGLSPQSVQPLIEMGHLKTGLEFSRDARRDVEVITRASVETFLRDYVCLGELTRASGLHHKQVRKALRECDIDEVIDFDSVNVFVYSRSIVREKLGPSWA